MPQAATAEMTDSLESPTTSAGEIDQAIPKAVKARSPFEMIFENNVEHSVSVALRAPHESSSQSCPLMAFSKGIQRGVVMPNEIVRRSFSQSAAKRVRVVEKLWNTRDPELVVLAYTHDSLWRDRTELLHGRNAIKDFLRRQWVTKLGYRVRKELWAVQENRVVVSAESEWHDRNRQWYKSKGVELWEFEESGLIGRRVTSLSEVPIRERDRRMY